MNFQDDPGAATAPPSSGRERRFRGLRPLRTWQKAQDRGVVFVCLNQQDSLADARRFLQEFDTSYLNVRDPGNEVARRWNLIGLPGTFFIDADGDVVTRIVGAASAASGAA